MSFPSQEGSIWAVQARQGLAPSRPSGAAGPTPPPTSTIVQSQPMTQQCSWMLPAGSLPFWQPPLQQGAVWPFNPYEQPPPPPGPPPSTASSASPAQTATSVSRHEVGAWNSQPLSEADAQGQDSFADGGLALAGREADQDCPATPKPKDEVGLTHHHPTDRTTPLS